MRVFVAGGTGAIGRRLLPRLVEAGHQVAATTRFPSKAEQLRSFGATPCVLDALDPPSVSRAVLGFRPDVVMNQLTSLPADYDLRKLGPWFERTAQLRVAGTKSLIAAAQATGSARFVYQSIAFMYAPVGPRVVDEDAPLMLRAAGPFGAAVRATVEGERLAMTADGMTGVVLRYGQLYGPGTHFDTGAYFSRQARRRLLPVVGCGTGIMSLVHVDDAAAASVCALERGNGIYNIVDDEPVLSRDFIPAFCAASGSPTPVHIPGWLGRLLGGPLVPYFEELRGASNARAKRELAWAPSHRTWRNDFNVRT